MYNLGRDNICIIKVMVDQVKSDDDSMTMLCQQLWKKLRPNITLSFDDRSCLINYL